MATEALCYRDGYAREIRAVVTAVHERDEGVAVELDRTVFYPGGGGQPADSGWLSAASSGSAGRWRVEAARKTGDAIVHVLAPREPAEGAALATPAPGDPAAPAPGDQVVAEIDWPNRHLLMRTHTALHALCGVVWRDYGALVTGGNMEPGRGRMDFEFERMSGDLVSDIESKVNTELAAAREVRIRFLPRDEAFAIPDLIRTKVNLLPEGIAEVRVVEIVGLDLQADGGTHVANTSQVGRIRVTGYESKGRINKRIRLEVADV